MPRRQRDGRWRRNWPVLPDALITGGKEPAAGDTVAIRYAAPMSIRRLKLHRRRFRVTAGTSANKAYPDGCRVYPVSCSGTDDLSGAGRPGGVCTVIELDGRANARAASTDLFPLIAPPPSGGWPIMPI